MLEKEEAHKKQLEEREETQMRELFEGGRRKNPQTEWKTSRERFLKKITASKG